MIMNLMEKIEAKKIAANLKSIAISTDNDKIDAEMQTDGKNNEHLETVHLKNEEETQINTNEQTDLKETMITVTFEKVLFLFFKT